MVLAVVAEIVLILVAHIGVVQAVHIGVVQAVRIAVALVLEPIDVLGAVSPIAAREAEIPTAVAGTVVAVYTAAVAVLEYRLAIWVLASPPYFLSLASRAQYTARPGITPRARLVPWVQWVLASAVVQALLLLR